MENKEKVRTLCNVFFYCGLQELFETVLSALHIAPMDGMGRAVVVAGKAVGTAAIVLPTWRQPLDVINGT